ncbi:Protein Brevis radix-like 2 [Cucurbita argyrosperma subsp. argyrosperma]
MLTCIACSKQLNNGSLHQQEGEDSVATPRTKQTIKALTAQIKDIALKASGAYKNCKPCSGSSSNNGKYKYAESDSASDSARFHCSYRRTGSANSIPRQWGKEMESRLKALSSGEVSPASVSGRTEIVFLEEDEPKEWVAQVEPGVLITFVSFPQGGNDLKRIRFSRELFNKWQAQRWWAENYEKVMELYNVQRFNSQAVPRPPSPPLSEDDASKTQSAKDSPATPPLTNEWPPRNSDRPLGNSSSESLDHHPNRPPHCYDSGGLAPSVKPSSENDAKIETSSVDGSVRTSEGDQSEEELSVSNASDLETEWIEEDEPGVYITIRALPGGSRELRRIRFSREKFGEMHARLWWEENRTRIQEQYL